MPGEWARVRVSEVCELIVDCVNKTAPVVEDFTPYKMLRTTNIKGGRIDRETCRRVSRDTFVKWTRRADVKHGDVILTREAPLGEVGYVDFDDTVFLGQRLMQYRANPAVLEPRFLLYSFLSKDLQNQFGAHEGSGSTVSHIRVGDCSKFELPLPPLAEQKAIAAVLGALDDKIELNRRINATLEAMARALFQSWFVDFDPVRAKLDGRQPVGLDLATAALFPDSFQDSEFGHIPKGWTVQPVGEVVDCVGGGTPSTTDPKYWQGGTHHWTTPKDFSSLQAPVLLDTDRKLTDAGIAKISSGLLPAGTLLLSSRAPVGYLAIAAMPLAINQGFIALKCNHRASNLFMLNWCQTNMAEIESRATGTTFAEISKQNFRPIRVVLPPKEIMAAFTAKVAPLYARITANLHQSHTLATLRDTLLPNLLNGTIRL
ncbi:MAG: restriction endonuclease subunit S [Haliea sp.]|jgi:type I restriction enzyme S subunit|nr:restriction endonuclease subunit S [Haliea sp.]